ncbi:response regulator [Rickettsiales endosymbiont of Peranema trichophorum]|uniref:response regulator n=1 Tax=Rickettsiales endosymbiont of Peranema trichophorum TaxID=2486577 RepID=UPI0010235E2D|nr:response regulator [Rickettsiales endosymbiont of Peranema trichophorum]RZI47334.1 response regulator [Rickettsiales endosymbiont of Peranema trichophorum]
MKCTVLLVDNEPICIASASYIMRSMGFEVIAANDTMAGIDSFEENQSSIDLVVTDYRNVYMDGIEFCSILRRKYNADIPMILLTSDIDITHTGMVATIFNAVMYKPFNVDEFLEHCQRFGVYLEQKATTAKV